MVDEVSLVMLPPVEAGLFCLYIYVRLVAHLLKEASSKSLHITHVQETSMSVADATAQRDGQMYTYVEEGKKEEKHRLPSNAVNILYLVCTCVLTRCNAWLDLILLSPVYFSRLNTERKST